PAGPAQGRRHHRAAGRRGRPHGVPCRHGARRRGRARGRRPRAVRHRVGRYGGAGPCARPRGARRHPFRRHAVPPRHRLSRALSEPVLLPGPFPVHFRGSRLARALLALAGWRVQVDGFPGRQGVAVVYPHTSHWDFVVGVLAKWAIGIPVSFWGKDTLFEVPVFGRWLRWLGGIPIERRSPKGAVGAMVQTMREAVSSDALLWLALSPEGTRRHTAGWRSGFYQ